ncbi:polyunsaturated fatty acid synthase PfaD, partial [Streptomyces sp. NPDC005776]
MPRSRSPGRPPRAGSSSARSSCRWYLGSSSRWAITGDASRRADYQIWCGPAM